MGKGDRRRSAKRRHKAEPQAAANTPQAPTTGAALDGTHRVEVIRPTPERMARGRIIVAERGAPAVDLAYDMIGRLQAEGQITPEQLQAGRRFQEIVAAFVAELGVAQYRSCLASGGGHDNGDGDPATFEAYNGLQRRLGLVRFLFLRTETAKGPGAMPANLGALRLALDAVGM